MAKGNVRCTEFDTKCSKMYHEEKLSIREIAKTLKVNRNTVGKALRGVPLVGDRVDPLFEAKCIKLAKTGMTNKAIADQLGCSDSKVQRLTKEARKSINIKKTTAVHRNEEAVLKLHVKGYSQLKIMKDLNLGRNTVQTIIEMAYIKGFKSQRQSKSIASKDPIAGRYALRVDDRTIIYPKISKPKENAIQSWNEFQSKREDTYRKSILSHRL